MNLEVPLYEELNAIFEKYHDDLGHPGMNSTVRSIQQRFTWVGMYPQIRNFVSIYVNI